MKVQDDLERLARIFDRLGAEMPRANDDAVIKWTMLGLARVKLAASGRPGPRRVTGDYTRSINATVNRKAEGGAEGTIGTNAAQARRLEFGFHGVDSLGRRYSQPPFPHWAPTAEWLLERVVNDAVHNVIEIINTTGRAS